MSQPYLPFAQAWPALWRTRWWVIISCVLVVLAYAGYSTLNRMGQPVQVRYTKAFNLSFPGHVDGRFPGGTPFVLSAMISPAVLATVHAAFELEDAGLSLDTFTRALKVLPDAPDYSRLMAQYQQRLEANNYPAAEIRSVQNDFWRTLNQNSTGAVRLRLTLPAGLRLGDEQANGVLTAIVNTWRERMVQQFGVLELNVPVYSPRVFADSRFEDLDYLITIDMLSNNLELVRDNVRQLQGIPNAAVVTDPETGYSLEDLDKALLDVARYDLRQLTDPVRELGLSRRPETMLLYYKRRLDRLQLQENQARGQARAAREVQASWQASGSGDQTTAPRAPSIGTISPQLGDAFLDRLVELSDQGSAQAFRQALSQQVLGYENRLLGIEQRRTEIQDIVTAVKEAVAAGPDDPLRQEFRARIETALPQVLATLRDHTATMNRLHQALGERSAGPDTEMVSAQANSFQVATPRVIRQQDIFRVAALLVLAGLGGILLGLLWQVVQGRRVGLQGGSPDTESF